MYQRYAVYFTPTGALAKAGASWLGWDLATGAVVAHPPVAGLDVAALTKTPRKYGLHGTIKPPFRLSDGQTQKMLADAVETLCARLEPVTLDGLEVQRLGRFIALIPAGDASGLADLAAQTVTSLDAFRAPASDAELARRRKANLTPSQDHNLMVWGYPHVLDDFRFHITLTGRIHGDIAPVLAKLRAHFAPYLAQPLRIDSLTLTGQDDDGMFHEIRRFPLTGVLPPDA